MAGIIIFTVSYLFYMFTYLKSGAGIVYPVYLAPAAVLSAPLIYAFILNKISGGKNLIKDFLKLANWLAVFAALFLTPILLKINLPEPHNFAERKFELIFGVTYAVYIALITYKFFNEAFFKADSEKTDVKKMFKFIAASFFVFYFFISLWLNYANQPTGDEPSYLLTAHSIVYDRDIDLKNNYDKKDYLKFYKKELLPQGTDIQYRGHLYSYHPLLLPVLVAPVYFAAGRFGAVITVNAAAAFFIALIFIFIYSVQNDKKSAVFAAAITGFTMPVISSINNISTEIVTAAVILAVYYMIKNKQEKNLFISIMAACMIWLHIRCLPIYAALCLIYVFYSRKKPGRAAVFVIVQILSVAAFIAFNYFMYGVIIPSYAVEGSNTSRFTPWNMPSGMLAFFIDRQMGLFSYAPVYIFTAAGAVLLFLKHKREFFEGLLLFVPYFLVISCWDDWGAGSAAPRYLVPLIFLFSLSFSAVLKYTGDKKTSMLIRTLAVFSILITVIILCVPWFRWDRPYGENYIMTLASKAAHFCVNCLFPSFKLGGNTAVTAVFWITLILAVNIFVIKSAVKSTSSKPV